MLRCKKKIILQNDKNSIKKASIILRRGGILVFPTDTVYGVGCLMDEKTIKQLYKIKNRSLSQPTAILLTKKLYESMRSSAKDTIATSSVMENDFFDGKITLVFPVNEFKIKSPSIIIKDSKVGIRLPQSEWLEKLIDIVGPIVTSSANKKGQPTPARLSEIDQDIIEQADLVIKMDEKLPGIPSRVYDLELKRYLR